MKKKTVHNISDIARLAGVSKSTVSRALNDSPLIGQETRERIQAFAAIDVIREYGRCVPEDVAVIGYDDLPIAEHSNPPLTTVRQNISLAGRLLAENMIQDLETGTVTNDTIPVELIVRKSA